MAGIDRLRGTQVQYLQLEEWLLKNQEPIRVLVGWCSIDGDLYEDRLPTDMLYDKEGYNVKDRPIASFGTAVNVWLKNNCPFDFVLKRIEEQYGGDI